jgi:NSS family neurotransmitter:Na+ symporter
MFDKRFKRGHLLMFLCLLEALLMWPSSHSNELIGQLDLIFGSGMQIFGATVAVVALVWGLGSRVMAAQVLPQGGDLKTLWLTLWLRWAIPIAFTTILLLYIYDQF